MVSQKVLIVMGCVSITLNLMSAILLLFTATTGTDILTGIAVYNSMDIEVPGELSFLGAEIIVTIVSYSLLIILAIMGSIFAMLDTKFRKIALGLLLTSQILNVITVLFNIVAIGVFHTEKSKETFDLQKFYVLNILIVFYLTVVLVYETIFMVTLKCSKNAKENFAENKH